METTAVQAEGVRSVLEISSEQVPPALAAMFDPSAPAGLRALAVLAGGNAGKILTDHPAHPQWGLVWEADDGILFRGGRYDRRVLSAAIQALRREGVVALAFREDDKTADLFPPDADAGAECLEFDRPGGRNDLSSLLGALPAGFAFQRMDRTLLERSPSRDHILRRYGSIDNLLNKGIAVCVLRGSETVCEAFADMDILGRRELGVTTQASFRRRGFAATVCAHLISLCEESGSHTHWDCARLNSGSVALARKLGFQLERRYRLLAWFGPRA